MKKLTTLLALACPLAVAAQDPTAANDPRATTGLQPTTSAPTEVRVIDDPHSVIPTEPGTSLVATADGLRIVRDDAVAAGPAATVQPQGPSAATVAPGEEARAAYGADTRAPDRLRQQQQATTRESSAPVMNSLLLAPRGIALLDRIDRVDRGGERAGLLGLELDHVLGGPLSLVTGVDFGRRDRGPGLSDETTVGLNGGVNLFLLGGHNKGLYVGPRVAFAAAGVPSAVDSAADRFGYGGEVGLRAIVRSGFTAGLAAGVLNQTRGTVNYGSGVLGSPTSRSNFGYGAVQLGWSW